MAQVNRLSFDYNQQLPTSSAGSTTQGASLYASSPHVNFQNHQQSVGLSLPENGNDSKPALPPKPLQGPPVYREPPTPPTQSETRQHPDICINSSHSRSIGQNEYEAYSNHPPHSIEKPERFVSRTHAWVQEHKSSGKLVGEKLSSLQRKLRSFLTQSSTTTKDVTEFEKHGQFSEVKPRTEVCDNWISYSSEALQRTRPYSSNGNITIPPSSSENLNYISASSFGSNSVALPITEPVTHNHNYRPYHADRERHPFAAPGNTSEQDDSTDPDQMRDTCNKLFSREQRISWTNYMHPRNSYSNNIKSSYDYDKLVPKEVIGRPSQDKRPEAIYDVTFPNFTRALDISSEPSESQPAGRVFYPGEVGNCNDENDASASASGHSKTPNEHNESQNPLQHSVTESADTVEVYKSSSESGRGTMHSSMHGSKHVMSPHSSGVSAVSNLDTSIDSDHSANGTLWSQQNPNCPENEYSEGFNLNKVKHIYEKPTSEGHCEKDDDGSCESLSETPPLPPLSPPPSPPGSAEISPKLSTKAKYKMSLSASALNASYSKSSDHQPKMCDMPLSKTAGKKNSVRRTTSINQCSSRHRPTKNSQYSKASSSHRIGVGQSSYSSRKCNSSPPSRHHSKSQLGFPCYLDNMDAELTSTTTGLDMESLLDEEEDYSSDLSASTMEPDEVIMIRKQLESLETMYSEILHLLGVKTSGKANAFASSLDVSRHSRRKLNGSLSSLTARSSASRGHHSLLEKRAFSEKRRNKEYRNSSASKRLQRLESHVVTLARSVAHLSSEMRTQHVLVQELENMRQDVTWVQERLRLMQLAQGCHPNSGAGKNHQISLNKDWDSFHKEVLELLNPSRANKLTKFFGDEPPLIRQFLKRLGYEKYASNFENEKIGIKELPYLTEERLQKMGIPMGPRIRILQEAISSCPQNQYKVYIV